jgi:peptide/nickel transport system permease protein
VVGATAGLIIGTASGYFGGRIDMTVQRILDVFLSFPLIVLALAVVAILGTGTLKVILAILVPMIPRTARVCRASALAVRETPYVDAARSAGTVTRASSCATWCRTSSRPT